MGQDEGVREAAGDTRSEGAAPPDAPAADAPAAGSPAAAPPTRPEAVLAGYRDRMRRARLIYAAVIAVVVVVLGVVAGVAYSRGEITHAHLRTAPSPPTLPLAAPAADQQPAWRTSDRPALGTPLHGGTVITFSTHTVGGRNARTGRPTWTYTRTDRTVCTATQQTNDQGLGTTIAVYAVHGNCDELTAFDTDTGRRRWSRTLDEDGRPMDGRPAFQALPYTLLITSATTIYAIDPATGYDRWTYYRYGCHIDRAVLGSSGALIGQTCGAAVRCSGVKFCAKGPQVLLRDGTASRADNGNNRDRVIWLRRGAVGRPVSADDVLSVLAPGGGSLLLLADKDGAPQQQVTLGRSGGPDTTAFAVGTTELVWRSGTTYAITSSGTRPAWTASTDGPPSAVSPTGAAPVALAGTRITATRGGVIVALDGVDGRVTGRYPLSAGGGPLAYPLGTGFLVGGPAGTAAYR